jgi:hypothetical protein
MNAHYLSHRFLCVHIAIDVYAGRPRTVPSATADCPARGIRGSGAPFDPDCSPTITTFRGAAHDSQDVESLSSSRWTLPVTSWERDHRIPVPHCSWAFGAGVNSTMPTMFRMVETGQRDYSQSQKRNHAMGPNLDSKRLEEFWRSASGQQILMGTSDCRREQDEMC